MAIRDLLMLIYAIAWLVVMVSVTIRTGLPPAELWTALGVGEGALLAIFRGEQMIGRRRGGAGTDVEDES